MNFVRIRSLKNGGESSFHRRAFNHNYYEPFIYHIILNKAESCGYFGSVAGDARIPFGNSGCARIEESELGIVIAKQIVHLPYEYPIIKILQYKVMPDHVHILLQVLFKSNRHLDFYVETLMQRIAQKYSLTRGQNISVEDIFEPGYCDKPLYDNRNLNELFDYIRHNPHRLAARRQYPQFFQTVRQLVINNNFYSAYGNLFLLRNPDKYAVKISRNDTFEAKATKKELWLTMAATKSVLVSSFISPDEKQIRAEAEKLGAKIIFITHQLFSDRFKPSGRDFDLCAQGRLLIISLGMPKHTKLTYTICTQMNDLAKLIATK